MNKEKKTVPQLRFPEFVNDGEWQYLNGDELFEPISNRDHNSDLPILAISQEHGAIPREMIDYTVIASKESINSYKVVEKGDFIISLRSFQGGIEYSNYKGICSPAYIILRKKKKLDDIFFKFYFKTDLYIRHINKNLEGIRDGKMVSYKQFSEILLPYPSVKEQQKIVSCLSSLDDLIETQKQKLDALKDHKKGLMQDLFPQEGKKTPNFRFPEFGKNEEWEVKVISKIGETINGLVGKSGEDFGAGKPYVTYKQVFDNSVINFEKCGRVQIKDFENQNKLQYGDVLFTTSSETPNEVGFASVLLDFPKEETYLNSFCFALRPFDLKITLPQFLRYLFQSPMYRNSITALAQGSTRYNISKNAFLNLVLLIPLTNEQLKIASCLSSLDNLIKAQSDKIEQLREHKKGLMQGLFPKIND